jgi:hypothetical protein
MAEMTPVKSSNVAAVGWENGTLYVEFLSGSTYAYEGVDEVAYQDLLGSSSVGQYLNRHIKPGRAARRL